MTNDFRAKTRDSSDRIGILATNRAGSQQASAFWLKLAVVAGGGVATAMQFINAQDGKYRADQLAGIAAALVVCLLAGILLRFDSDASQHLDEARRALDHAKDAIADADQVKREASAVSSLRDAED